MTSGVAVAPPELDSATLRRGFLRACVIGAAVAAVAFTWMLLIGRLDLLHSEGLSGFYDAQAHALLGGHWDIPAGKLGFEAFLIDGKQYMYFGPWPAFLRLPIAAVTDAFDGELTQLSMLLAFAVLMVATVRLLWRVRTLVRPDRPLTRLEQWAAGVFVLVVGAGSRRASLRKSGAEAAGLPSPATVTGDAYASHRNPTPNSPSSVTSRSWSTGS